ncbi:hypothetical protein V1318_19435 [Lysobacter sp. CCNWLW3]|uniref:hypothetical protein n=1 Tax=unclassified Lysobacter TaxID=2635362 RepID=UPI002FD4A83E
MKSKKQTLRVWLKAVLKILAVLSAFAPLHAMLNWMEWTGIATIHRVAAMREPRSRFSICWAIQAGRP